LRERGFTGERIAALWFSCGTVALMSQSVGPDISDLLFRACHELRTHLRSMHVRAQLVQKTGEKVPEFVGIVLDSSRKLDLLADGLTSYTTALDIDQSSFQPVRMDVMLRTVLAGLDQELRANEAEVTYSELPSVFGDPDRIADLLRNLIGNALRHRGEAPPRICITAEKQANRWLLTVKDNGPGIEAPYLESVFKPFERLHGREREGPGLGLAICRAIVEGHGGTIWAECEPTSGCAFRFILPAS
jgi:light-regulated signal transduction histidine kinase (bacteriophytochrome)